MSHDKEQKWENSIDSVAYRTAVDEIYARAELGEGGLTERILQPVYEAAISSVDSSNVAPNEVGMYEVAIAEIAAGVLRRLKLNQELDPNDRIIHGFNWHDVGYIDSNGNEYVIDPVNNYVGLLEDAESGYAGLSRIMNTERNLDERRSQEADLRDSGEVETHRLFLNSGEVDVPLKGQDSLINDVESGTFAIFDGMGGHKGGEVASRIAKETFLEAGLSDFAEGDPQLALDAIVETMHVAVDKMKTEELADISLKGMGSTAVVAQVVRHVDKHFVAWASVGDSRLYDMPDTVRGAQQVSLDEGYANVVTNVLSNGFFKGVKEANKGIFEIDAYSRVMICSDGITGDSEAQAIDIDEISKSLSTRPIQSAADSLLHKSTKPDDKSLVVFELGGTKQEPRRRTIRNSSLGKLATKTLETFKR